VLPRHPQSLGNTDTTSVLQWFVRLVVGASVLPLISVTAGASVLQWFVHLVVGVSAPPSVSRSQQLMLPCCSGSSIQAQAQ
jgi:hypothetical protein